MKSLNNHVLFTAFLIIIDLLMTKILYRYDFLKIYEPSRRNSEIASLTGVLPPNITSTGPELSLQFISDQTEVKAGFLIKFEAGI